mgnify:CR=1 FL=1
MKARQAGQDLGSKLRMLRRARAMTLAELASAASCSESMVSKIETGRVNPSINLLHRLVDALDFNFAALFDRGSEGGIVSRAGQRPMLSAGGPRQGVGHIIEQLVPLVPDFALQANIHVIAPGGTTGEPISHPGDEIGYVLQGRIELEVEEEVHSLTEGDSFHFRSGRFHTYRNPGGEEARLVLINTPPTF